MEKGRDTCGGRTFVFQ